MYAFLTLQDKIKIWRVHISDNHILSLDQCRACFLAPNLFPVKVELSGT